MASNGSLATQLRPLQERMRVVSPRVRHVVQVTADLAGRSPAEAADIARQEILRWLHRRAGPLPEGAWRGDSFEHEPAPGQHASVIALTEPADYWAARLDHPDDRVPGRTWSTESAVAVTSGRACFGVRLTCASRQDDPAIERTTPGLVRQLAERPGLLGSGWAVLPRPHTVRTEEDVERLAALIEAPARTRPVYVVSLPGDAGDQADAAAVDVARLADHCLGIGDVFVIPAPLTFTLSDRLGREYSVFNGAVRTYRPGFNLYEDPPSRHPLAFADRIAGWPGGPGAFEDMLVERAYESSIRIPEIERALPSFAAVKKLHLELRRREVGVSEQPDGELFRLYDEEIAELRRDLEAARALGEEAEAKLEQVCSELDGLRSREHWLRAECDRLRREREASMDGGTDVEPELPESLDDVQSWAEQALVGRLVIHPRAARVAKKAEYENPQLAYRALLLLAREYRDLKVIGGQDRQQAFESGRRKLGLDCTPAFAGAGYGEQGDAYFVDWGGRPRRLDLHLKNGGNTRDPKRCLRIYFFWDDEESQVVVGSLPAHLPTRAA